VNLDADGSSAWVLQKCAAIIDLPNTRLYLKPPELADRKSGTSLRELGYHPPLSIKRTRADRQRFD